jgi:hypothetical protein
MEPSCFTDHTESFARFTSSSVMHLSTDNTLVPYYVVEVTLRAAQGGERGRQPTPP